MERRKIPRTNTLTKKEKGFSSGNVCLKISFTFRSHNVLIVFNIFWSLFKFCLINVHIFNKLCSFNVVEKLKNARY